MRHVRWVVVALAFGCPEDEEKSETPTETAPTSATTDAGGCADPDVNPYAGTCVETFFAGCFDPAGECVVTTQGLRVDITWENGAAVEQRGFVTTLVASDGTECATGDTSVGGGACFSTTVYTRSSDGATQTYCTTADGTLTVTCDDGSSFDLTPEESAAGQSCQYGGDEACTLGGA